MKDLTDRELLELLGEKTDNKNKPTNFLEERIISGFEDINNFFEKNNRFPENKLNRNVFERIYSIRLNILKNNQEYKNLLLEFDKYDLLSNTKKNEKDLDHKKMTDSELLSSLGALEDKSDITKLKYVRSYEERRIAEEFANREKCIDFSKYKSLFENIQNEIKEGNRKYLPLNKRPEIKKGMFFVVGGQKTYVAEVGETFKQDYGINDARLYLIFDNGTESRMLLRSLQRALTMDKSSRIISDTNLGPLFTNIVKSNDQFKGTIYILRSNSNLTFIAENRSLIHKIGFTTTTVQKRIANAKSDPTFLMAEVEVVGSYKLFNIKSSKFENLVQQIFSNVKLDIDIIDRFGNPVKPNEWFFVPLDVIKDAIQKIIDGSITKYFYDPSKAKLIETS